MLMYANVKYRFSCTWEVLHIYENNNLAVHMSQPRIRLLLNKRGTFDEGYKYKVIFEEYEFSRSPFSILIK